MSDFQVLIPKLGESIQEATITKIFVKSGDVVTEDDPLFEVATDKVDSEIPSPVAGKVLQINYQEGDLVAVGKVVLVIDTGGTTTLDAPSGTDRTESPLISQESPSPNSGVPMSIDSASPKVSESPSNPVLTTEENTSLVDTTSRKGEKPGRFYSPLVRSIATKEGIPLQELETLPGSGLGGRIQKQDLLNYIEERRNGGGRSSSQQQVPAATSSISANESQANPLAAEIRSDRPKVSVSIGAEDTVVMMDRVRKLIANHMVMSKQVSPHVTTVLEADVTDLVLWRNKNKDQFEKLHGEKLTFMPFFTQAVANALQQFRQVNASVDGDSIILRKHINIGIAVATNDGNLIVPVIKDADNLNLLGLTRSMNHFAKAGREGKLMPDDLSGGTFTITNFGTFGGLIGTPIINQPQVAILAVGMIEKKPAVMETPTGDVIVVRHKMFLSLTYDHRIVDGMLGGKFLRAVADHLENFQTTNAL